MAKHLATLAEAGLVSSDRQGRETRFSFTPQPLADAVSWMADVGRQWDDRLQALSQYLETGEPRPKRRRAGFDTDRWTSRATGLRRPREWGPTMAGCRNT